MDLSLCGPLETKKMTKLARHAAVNAQQDTVVIDKPVCLSQWMQDLLQGIDCNMPFETKCPDQMVTINPGLLKKALIAIISLLQNDNISCNLNKYENTVSLSFQQKTEGIYGFDALFSILRNATVSDPMNKSVFLAFFAIYHHGGHITIEETISESFLKIVLPVTQDMASCDQVENYDWIDDVFDMLETAGY